MKMKVKMEGKTGVKAKTYTKVGARESEASDLKQLAADIERVECATAIDFQLKRYAKYDQACRQARESLMDMLRERSKVISDLLALTNNGKQSNARFMLADSNGEEDEYQVATFRPTGENGGLTGEKILYFRRVFKFGRPVKIQLTDNVSPFMPKCE